MKNIKCQGSKNHNWNSVPSAGISRLMYHFVFGSPGLDVACQRRLDRGTRGAKYADMPGPFFFAKVALRLRVFMNRSVASAALEYVESPSYCQGRLIQCI